MREKNTIHLNAMCECVSASASINVCVRMIGVYSPPIEQVFNLAKLMRWPWKFRKSSQHFVVLLSMPLLPLLLLVLHMLRCYSFIRIHVFDFLLLLLRRFFQMRLSVSFHSAAVWCCYQFFLSHQNMHMLSRKCGFISFVFLSVSIRIVSRVEKCVHGLCLVALEQQNKFSKQNK